MQIDFDIGKLVEEIKNKTCLKYTRKIWILKLISNKKIEDLKINGIKLQEFIYKKLIEFNFSDELIEHFLNMIDIHFFEFEKKIEVFFKFIKENMKLKVSKI